MVTINATSPPSKNTQIRFFFNHNLQFHTYCDIHIQTRTHTYYEGADLLIAADFCSPCFAKNDITPPCLGLALLVCLLSYITNEINLKCFPIA